MNSFRTKNYADQDAVCRVAETLMLINGATTTLEVKKLLRLEGFIAYQQQVSQAMDNLTQYKNWAYSCNGRFRTYTFKIQMDYSVDPSVPPFGYN